MATDERKGSGFVNLQRIIGANQGNRLGQKISSGIRGQADKTRQDVDTASEQFRQGAEAANPLGQPIQSKLSNIIQAPTSASKEDTQLATDVASGQGYKGPQTLQDAPGLIGRAQAAESLGQASRSAEGRTGLLSRFVGSPTYTTGQKNLDTIILGRTGAPEVRQAAQTTKGLESKANQAVAQAGGLYAQRLADARQAGETFKGQLTEKSGAIKQEGQTKAQKFLDQEAKLKGAEDYWASQAKELRGSFLPNGAPAPGSKAEEFQNFLLSNGMSPEAATNAMQHLAANANRFNKNLKTGEITPVTSDQDVGNMLRAAIDYRAAPGLDFAGGGASDQALKASLSDDQKAQMNALARISGQPEPFSAADFGLSPLQQGTVNYSNEALKAASGNYSPGQMAQVQARPGLNTDLGSPLEKQQMQAIQEKQSQKAFNDYIAKGQFNVQGMKAIRPQREGESAQAYDARIKQEYTEARSKASKG